MIRIYQLIIDPERGDCHRAAIATILGLALEDVPADIASGFVEQDFLRARGLAAVQLQAHDLRPRPEAWFGPGPWDARHLVRYDFAEGAVALASVPSQRFQGGWHSVVVGFVLQPKGWVRVELLHDPNPRNAPYDMDTTEIRSLTLYMPRPAAVEAPHAE